ncbi:threonine aldolase family protein [Kingella kingae]|uniref:threonine aldolase family protein n=1 Tax=Kingella kingae TaxID=504 RepID=UPI001E2BFE17|nr:beta-eliminating lyase-related protein [Kingella kingae]
MLKQQFGEQAQGFPVFNGTGVNVLALQALLPRWGAVVCSQTAHINVDESVAPQWVGGFKLWAIATPDGKLSPELIAQEAHGFGFEHRAQPLAVSMTQSTELGTLYTPDELRAICDFCHKNGMAVHLDGARLANVAAALGVSLREITTDVGVDIVSFGGTKNGLLLGECVVILNPERVSDGMKYLRKMNVQLASKMRFISAQLVALLENDLWLKSASNTNKMAQKLSGSLQNMDGVELVYPTQANAVFAKLPNGVADKVRELTYFYDWDEQGTVRFVCSFDTTEQHVDELVAATRAAIG